MRVISGTAKGRTLLGPKDNRIRPALDKVKQAVFNILGNIQDTHALDLFAGTGSMGIEALSRGTSHAVFVNGALESLRLTLKNLSLCRFEARATLLKLKLPESLGRVARKLPRLFNLIFVDPPYDKNLVNPTLAAIADEKILAPGGWVIVEHSPRELLREDTGLTLLDQRKYGQTIISFLKGEDANHSRLPGIV